MGSLASDFGIGNCGLGPLALESLARAPWLGIFSLGLRLRLSPGSFAWMFRLDLSLVIFHVRSFTCDISLGIFRLGSLAHDCSLWMFRLNFELKTFRLGSSTLHLRRMGGGTTKSGSVNRLAAAGGIEVAGLCKPLGSQAVSRR